MARTASRIASLALAVVGGAMMAFGGVANHSFLLTVLSLVQSNLTNYLSGTTLFIVQVSIVVISLLIGLGGLTVAAGGILIFTGHRTLGRLLIALGGGAGFLGLLISFGYTAFTVGVASALAHSIYWVGLILAVVARRIAKGA